MGRGHHRTQRGDGGRWCLFIFSVIESLYDTHSIRVVESELEIAFSVERSRTNLDDVDAFIAEHQNAKNGLVVGINHGRCFCGPPGKGASNLGTTSAQ